MHISNINQNQTNFGRLRTGLGAKEKLCSKNCPKDLINRFVYKRKAIRKSGINKLEFVDVVLDYKDQIGYVLNIIKKSHDKWYYERELDSLTTFSDDENHIKKLKEWGSYWNQQVKNSMPMA